MQDNRNVGDRTYPLSHRIRTRTEAIRKRYYCRRYHRMKTEANWKMTADAYTERLILPSDPLSPLWNRENIIFRKAPKWNYIDACMMTAAAMLYDLSGDERLLSFIVRFIVWASKPRSKRSTCSLGTETAIPRIMLYHSCIKL